MDNKKIVLLFSAGMDSSLLLYLAAERGAEEIHTLSLDYGQRHIRELSCIDKQLKNVREAYPDKTFTNKVLDVRFLRDISPTSSLTNSDIDNPDINKIAGDAQPVSYVPFRNQMFLSICCAYAESIKAKNVWYGAAQVDSLAGYWDGDISFVDAFEKLISLNRQHNIRVEAPLLVFSKADIVKTGIRLGVKFGETWTCYSDRADGLADATTPSSSLRLQGFMQSGYRDPIKYLQQDDIDKLYDQYNCKFIK
jgi:7-cyano-7-deazaguanine synthase